MRTTKALRVMSPVTATHSFENQRVYSRLWER
jgi:hypothetical protein